MRAIGKKEWVIPGGHIPFQSTGKEPEFISQDRISVLNTNNKSVEISITIFYSDKETVSPVRIKIQAQRVRKIRINDIIGPFPVPLETDYALHIKSEEPVLIQFTRMNTGSDKAAIMGSMAFGTDL